MNDKNTKVLDARDNKKYMIKFGFSSPTWAGTDLKNDSN